MWASPTRYAFAFLAKGEICQKQEGFISYRIDAQRQYIEFEHSENISNSSFVNIFHESEYIDRIKNESKNRRICFLLLLLFLFVIMPEIYQFSFLNEVNITSI